MMEIDGFFCPSVLIFFYYFHTVQLQIEALTRRLLTGDLGIPDNPDERFANIVNISHIFLQSFNSIDLMAIHKHLHHYF